MSAKALPAWFALILLLLTACGDPLSIRQKCFTNGNKMFEKGKYKEASILYRRALQLDPKYADAWYRLGLTDLKLGDGNAARAAFQRTVDLNPDNDDAVVRLADAYAAAASLPLSDGPRERVIQTLGPLVERVSTKNPASYDARRLSGYLALIKRDRKLAIEKFRAANQAKPSQPEVMLALVELLTLDGHADEAERIGEDFLAQRSDDTPMYILLLDLNLHTGHLDRVETILKHRIQKVGEDGPARLQLALLYYMTSRRPESLAVLDTLRNDRKKVPDADALIAEFDLLTHDLNGAIQAYRDGEKFNSKEKLSYEEKAIEILLMQGKKGEALDAAERLSKANPKDAGVSGFRTMMRAEIDPRELQNTINTLENLAAQNTRNESLQFYLGRAYRQKRDSRSLEKARTHLDTAIALRPDLAAAKILLAQVHLLQNDGPGSIQAANDVLRRDPSNLTVRITRAMAFSMVHEPDKARQDLLVALALHRNSAEARLRLASLDLSQKRFQEAEKGFEMVAAAGDPRGFVGMAQLKVAQGRQRQALEVLHQQCSRFPESRDCLSTMASLELRAGRLADAKNSYERLTQLEPQSAEYQAHLGDVQFSMGDSAGAMASFRKARELDPSNGRAALGIAVILDASGKTAQAAAAYEEALRIDSNNAQALNNLAYIKAEQGTDLDRAVSMAEKAVQLSPDNAGYLDTLGFVYYKHGLTRAAIGIFEPLVKKHPENASFHLHLAMALFAGAKQEQATKELQMAMRHRHSPAEQRQIEDLAAKIQPISRERGR